MSADSGEDNVSSNFQRKALICIAALSVLSLVPWRTVAAGSPESNGLGVSSTPKKSLGKVEIVSRMGDMVAYRDAQGHMIVTNKEDVFGGRKPRAPQEPEGGTKGSTLVAMRDKYGGLVLTNQPGEYDEIEAAEPRNLPRARNRRVAKDDNDWVEIVKPVVAKYHKDYGVPEPLIWAVIEAESGGDPNAVSRKGCVGLMQLHPDTAVEVGVHNRYDPKQNVKGGTLYLARMLQRFDDNERLALAAYNAGPEMVEKYGGIPPFKETQDYVKRVLRLKEKYSASTDGGLKGQS